MAHVHVAVHPGLCFVMMDLKITYWHVPTDYRYCWFLAFQGGCDVLHFTVLPFKLNIMPQVFIKLNNPVA